MRSFAPKILATIQQLADEFKEEIARLRIIARHTAITDGLWFRSEQARGGSFSRREIRWARIDQEENRL